MDTWSSVFYGTVFHKCLILHLLLGLRTLCIAMAELEPEEFQRWSDIYYKASTSLENREKNVDEAAELIEKVRGCLLFHLCCESPITFLF